jgi:hypothetical protein
VKLGSSVKDKVKMKLATSTQVIFAKKKRMVLCFLLLAGKIVSSFSIPKALKFF